MTIEKARAAGHDTCAELMVLNGAVPITRRKRRTSIAKVREHCPALFSIVLLKFYKLQYDWYRALYNLYPLFIDTNTNSIYCEVDRRG